MTVGSRDGMPSRSRRFELTTEPVEIIISRTSRSHPDVREFDFRNLEDCGSRAGRRRHDTVTYRVEMRNATAALSSDAASYATTPASFPLRCRTAGPSKNARSERGPSRRRLRRCPRVPSRPPSRRARSLNLRVRIALTHVKVNRSTRLWPRAFLDGETVRTLPAQATVTGRARCLLHAPDHSGGSSRTRTTTGIRKGENCGGHPTLSRQRPSVITDSLRECTISRRSPRRSRNLTRSRHPSEGYFLRDEDTLRSELDASSHPLGGAR